MSIEELIKNEPYKSCYEYGEQQGRADERPKAFGKGYDSGYQKGREDREKELAELPNEYSERLWKNAYDKGRADAIDDALQILKAKHMIRTSEDDFVANVEVPFYRNVYASILALEEQKK